MATDYTDYILFIHGVNTREKRENPNYAKKLICRIEQEVKSQSPELKPKSIPLYWGDVNTETEEDLLGKLRASPKWEHLWFKELRERQLMQFAGDAALYISRYMGSKVVDRLKEEILHGLEDWQSGDRLHLVTHSWGTVILFDILFASRWNNPNIPAYESAQTIRRLMFGIPPQPLEGIRLASIHTMGSPIALFSLLDVTRAEEKAEGKPELQNPDGSPRSNHDITPQLGNLLEEISKHNPGMKLPWWNFMHPGDPIAYPLETLVYSLVDGEQKYLNIQDVITHKADFSDFLFQPLSQSPLSLLLHGGDAHSSYWESHEVAVRIAETIKQTAQSLKGLELKNRGGVETPYC